MQALAGAVRDWRCDVCFWPLADIPITPSNVCFWGQSGHGRDNADPIVLLMLGTITAFFLGVILFVIVALDRPLRGVSGLDPNPIRLLWERQMVWDEPLS
jgi:hypothetical protein